jgi:hypothetical protein
MLNSVFYNVSRKLAVLSKFSKHILYELLRTYFYAAGTAVSLFAMTGAAHAQSAA